MPDTRFASDRQVPSTQLRTEHAPMMFSPQSMSAEQVQSASTKISHSLATHLRTSHACRPELLQSESCTQQLLRAPYTHSLFSRHVGATHTCSNMDCWPVPGSIAGQSAVVWQHGESIWSVLLNSHTPKGPHVAVLHRLRWQISVPDNSPARSVTPLLS